MATNGVKTESRLAFIDWWFSVDRTPKTMGEWAEQNGVARQTLTEWKQLPEFKARLDAYRTLFRPDFIDATRVMIGLAKKGDVQAYQAAAKVLGENAPEKMQVSVDRVAYTHAGALRDLADSLDSRPN